MLVGNYKPLHKLFLVLPHVFIGILAAISHWNLVVLLWAYLFQTGAIVIFSGSKISHLTEKFNITTRIDTGPAGGKPHFEKGAEAGLWHIVEYLFISIFLLFPLLFMTREQLRVGGITLFDLAGLMVSTSVLFAIEIFTYYQWKKYEITITDPKIEIENLRNYPKYHSVSLFVLYITLIFFVD